MAQVLDIPVNQKVVLDLDLSGNATVSWPRRIRRQREWGLTLGMTRATRSSPSSRSSLS